MMFNTLVVFPTSGTLKLKISDDITIDVKLSEQECDTIRSMCEQFYSERQHKISEQVARPLPALAHFEEVSS